MSDQHPGQGHRGRLRDKFLQHGIDKFTDEEILELLLTLATPRQDCKQRAREMLAHFGELAYVLEASHDELAALPGIGPKNILGLKLIPAVAKRYLESKIQAQPSVYNHDQLAIYLRYNMGALTQEAFQVISLDIYHRVCGTQTISLGTIDKSTVYPRQVIEEALRKGASSIVCAHNHPSGIVQPSASDIAMTRQIYLACRSIDIELLDHVIVGREETYSFAQAGKIALLDREFMNLGW